MSWLQNKPIAPLQVVEAEIDVAALTPTPTTANQLTLMSVQEILSLKSTLPPRKYFLYPAVVENSIILVVAEAGTGKSMFMLSMLSAISKGENFIKWENAYGATIVKENGKEVVRWAGTAPTAIPVRCLYLDGEMSIYDSIERIEDLQVMIIYSTTPSSTTKTTVISTATSQIKHTVICGINSSWTTISRLSASIT